MCVYLHCDHTIVDDHLFGEEIGTDRRLVLVGEALVHVLVHQRRFADAAVAQNDHLQEDFLARRHDAAARVSIGMLVVYLVSDARRVDSMFAAAETCGSDGLICGVLCATFSIVPIHYYCLRIITDSIFCYNIFPSIRLK